MTEPQLYIPFADGLIGYDCVACGAGCCKSGRFTLAAHEGERLLAEHPALALFSLGGYDHKKRLRISKADPACFFLTDELACAIEVRQGRAHKPLSCRLHPVYLQPLLSRGVVVAHVAPGCRWLTDADCARAVGKLTWAEARSHHAEYLRRGLYDALDPPKPWDTPELATLLEREQAIVEQSARSWSVRRYLGWQLAAAEAGDMESAADTSPRLRLAEATLERLEQRILRFLGVAQAPAPAPELERQFCLFCPMLRVFLLGLVYPAPLTGSWPPAQLERALPKVLLALYVFVGVLAALRGATSDQRRPDYNSCVDLLRKFGARLHVLACLEERFFWERGSADPARVRLEQLGLSPTRAGSFGDQLESICVPLLAAQRMHVLDAIADSLGALGFETAPSSAARSQGALAQVRAE